MRTPWLLLAAIVSCAPACSNGGGNSGDDLSVATVTHLPDGTGTGTAASGTYTVQFHPLPCSGACSSSVISLCNVGPAFSATMPVMQSDGHLTVHGDSGAGFPDLSGGINADGTFDVGGLNSATQGQNSLTGTYRAQGTLSGNTVTGAVESQTVGTLNGSALDCLQTLQILGSK